MNLIHESTINSARTNVYLIKNEESHPCWCIGEAKLQNSSDWKLVHIIIVATLGAKKINLKGGLEVDFVYQCFGLHWKL